jgi:4-carboxymuconolactone decarboxylase
MLKSSTPKNKDTSMARLQPIPKEAMTDDQRRVHDVIAAGPRGSVRGPLAMWLHRPKLAECAQALGQYCRYDSSLSPFLSEFAILLMAVHWKSEYEWFAHKPIALKAGVSPRVVDAVRDGVTPDFENAEQAMVYEVVTTLHAQRSLTDDLYARAVALLGEDKLLDLIGLAGYYTLISMTINVFGVTPPAGSTYEISQAPA